MVPLISFFHPERLWLLALVPVMLVLYGALLQRSRTRSRTQGIDNLAKVMPKQAAWKRHIAVLAAVNMAFDVDSHAQALALAEQAVPPTANYETPDPECDLNYTPNVARQMQVDVALANGFGFGGQNASAVFRRFVD